MVKYYGNKFNLNAQIEKNSKALIKHIKSILFIEICCDSIIMIKALANCCKLYRFKVLIMPDILALESLRFL